MEQVSSDAERLLTRLIMKADDYGRYHADPRLVKAGCFPLLPKITVEQVNGWIDELAENDLILTYVVNGRTYIVIPDFGQRTYDRVKPKFPCRTGEQEPWFPSRESGTVRDSPGQSGNFPLNSDSSPGTSRSRVRACASPTPTPTTTSSERGTGGKPKRLHGIPSTVEEVIDHGNGVAPPLGPVSEERCRAFWAHYEGQARTGPNGDLFWVTSGANGGTVVTNWKVKLPMFGEHIGKNGQANVNGHGTWDQKQQIEAKQNQRRDLRMKHAAHENPDGTWSWPPGTERHQEQARKIGTEIKELESRIANK